MKRDLFPVVIAQIRACTQTQYKRWDCLRATAYCLALLPHSKTTRRSHLHMSHSKANTSAAAALGECMHRTCAIYPSCRGTPAQSFQHDWVPPPQVCHVSTKFFPAPAITNNTRVADGQESLETAEPFAPFPDPVLPMPEHSAQKHKALESSMDGWARVVLVDSRARPNFRRYSLRIHRGEPDISIPASELHVTKMGQREMPLHRPPVLDALPLLPSPPAELVEEVRRNL